MKKIPARYKKVMVFGVFDRLHPGHLSFLKQAKKYGEKLIVVVARDNVVRKLKNKVSSQNEKERMTALRGLPEVDKVILGDQKQGNYGVIKKHKPDVICFGYDQKWLQKDLEKKMTTGELPKIELIQLTPHKPEKFHTSILRS